MLHFRIFPAQSFLTIALICAVSSSGFAISSVPPADSTYYRNPESFIAKKVLEGNIVMLADASHHYFDVYNSLLKVLYRLADEVPQSQKTPTKLSVILEMSPGDARALENYVTGGTLDELLKRVAPNLFYEDLEYYSNLRKFYEYSAEKSNLKIHINGFESLDAEPSFEIIKATGRQIDSISMLRDSILSLKVIKYIKDNPDSKTLIFYGGGHLLKGLSHKRATFGTCGDCLGYYMADYLKRDFGEEYVLTFDQRWLPPEYFRGTNLAEAEFSDIVAPASSIDTSQLKYTEYDYFVLWNETLDNMPPHRFDIVFSRKSAEKYRLTLENYDSTGQNENTKLYYNSLIYFFNLITCNDFTLPKEVAGYKDLGSYLGIEVMMSDCFKKRIYELYAHSKSKKLLNMFGFISGDLETSQVSDTLKKFNEIWDVNLRQIIFLNQIGVMWFGYPDEQKRAREYLFKYSGLDSGDPADYLRWYRINKN